MPTITPTYTLTPPSNTNTFSSKTENVAIERAEYELERTAYMNKIHAALATLKREERTILIERYLKEDVRYDIDIWTDLHIGKTKFYKLKWQAMLRMAFALKVEVYFNESRGVAVWVELNPSVIKNSYKISSSILKKQMNAITFYFWWGFIPAYASRTF